MVGGKNKNDIKRRIWNGIVNRALTDGDNSLPEFDTEPRRQFFYRKIWLRAAAAACILGGFSVFLFRVDKVNTGQLSEVSFADQDMNNQSTLIFPNGDSVIFDRSVEKGRILYQNGNLQLVKTEDDLLEIIKNPKVPLGLKTEEIVLKVNRGQQYRVLLSDSSLITVNASSKLIFPLYFTEKCRTVGLDGEAFFDVSTDSVRPFIVNSEDQVVRVYGTRFNVKNYGDEEQARTTLFEGKVSVRKVLHGKESAEHILHPGEYIVIDKVKSDLQAGKSGQTTEVLAWTKGLFIYENAPLRTVFKDFNKWYGVEVDWDLVPDLYFEGAIPRNYPLTKALEVIELTGGIKLDILNNQITFKNEK